MNRWWFVSLAALGVSAMSGCCRGDAGCSKDSDCKGARVCVARECVDAPPPAKTTPTAATATATTARPKSVVRRHRCTSGTPGEARGGCACGNQIINLCACTVGVCSPEYTIQGDTCVFTCPN